MNKPLGVLLYCLSTIGVAQANLVTGAFEGVIYGGWGSYGGYDFTQFDSHTVSGTFSFDPDALLSSYAVTDPEVMNAQYSYFPSFPVTITETVNLDSGSFDFTFIGGAFSETYAGLNSPSIYSPWTDWLYIQSSPTGTIGSFLSLRNSQGDHYLSDVQDLNSIGFSDSSPDSYGYSTFGDTYYNAPYQGGFSYMITLSTATNSGQRNHNIPEPSTILLFLSAGLAMASVKYGQNSASC